jgi:uncharacterized paraquat-inducible protein A
MGEIWLPENQRGKASKYLKHATESDIIQHFIKKEQEKLNRQLTEDETIDLFQNKSVCEKCEAIQLREYTPTGEKLYECPKCGHKNKLYPLGKYIAEGHWK